MKVLAFIIVSMVVTLVLDSAFAQQQPADPAFMQKAITALQAQRNEAADKLAIEAARSMMLSEENAKLKADLDKLKPSDLPK